MSSPLLTVLGPRLDALSQLVDDGVGLLPDAALSQGRDLVAHAADRLRHGTEHTVVALAGATGSGKSALFNALVRAGVARVGVTRPTTAEARAAVFGSRQASALLDWLDVRHRHGVDGAGELDGLVLLDLPDHDSVVTTHRLEVDRLVEVVDTMVWVLDPQKYADEALHDGYLRRLATHGDVMVFALNHMDEVPEGARGQMTDHLRGLLLADGLDRPVIVETSAVTGEGIDRLRAILVERITARDAALRRLDADVSAVAGGLGAIPRPLVQAAARADDALTAGLATAAGAAVIGDAVAAGYRHDAKRRTGWPFARWLLRFRRHPLRALQGRGEPVVGVAQAPTAVAVDHAHLRLSLREYADHRIGDAPGPWARRAREAAGANVDALPAKLSAAVTATARRATSPPRWWSAFGWLQRGLALAVITGALWLVGLGLLGYLRVPAEPFEVEIGGWPLPTLLLLGGVALGLLLAWVARLPAAIGGRRRGATAVKALERAVEDIAAEEVRAPLDRELERWERLGKALAAVQGGS